ncbi:MAG: SprT-like domain-containing protein [Chlamydiota bacterium]
MTIHTFQQAIEETVKKKVKLRINDNRSTMVSVKWEPDCTRVSMHRMFLEAPKNIMDALACHIKKENSKLCPSVKAFIEEKLTSFDYSGQLNENALSTKGEVYELQALYDKINEQYFGGQLRLKITWFGKKQRRRKSQVTFGLYQEATKLVKINRMMDSSFFPEYFVEFVIYHEMLHHVCRSYYDEKGKHRIHTPEFKKREQEFEHFELANLWMKKNYNNFFMM